MTDTVKFQDAIGIAYEDIGETVSLGSGKALGQECYGTYGAKWFIKKLYGNKPFGQLLLVSENGVLMIADPMQNSAIARFVVEESKTQDLSFCIGLVDDHVEDKNYRGRKGRAVVPGLWINVKIQDSTKKEKWLPSEAEAISFLKSRKMKPQIIVNAVSELQAYWLFEKPFIVNNRPTENEISKLSNEFQNTLIAEAQRHGWKIANTSCITNRQRIPGTWNRSLNPPAPITLLEVQNI